MVDYETCDAVEVDTLNLEEGGQFMTSLDFDDNGILCMAAKLADATYKFATVSKVDGAGTIVAGVPAVHAFCFVPLVLSWSSSSYDRSLLVVDLDQTSLIRGTTTGSVWDTVGECTLARLSDANGTVAVDMGGDGLLAVLLVDTYRQLVMLLVDPVTCTVAYATVFKQYTISSTDMYAYSLAYAGSGNLFYGIVGGSNSSGSGYTLIRGTTTGSAWDTVGECTLVQLSDANGAVAVDVGGDGLLAVLLVNATTTKLVMLLVNPVTCAVAYANVFQGVTVLADTHVYSLAYAGSGNLFYGIVGGILSAGDGYTMLHIDTSSRPFSNWVRLLVRYRSCWWHYIWQSALPLLAATPLLPCEKKKKKKKSTLR
eukprot:TRINITY_DN2189_c0_g1_i1.p1 TRINITY_DN2189_c0_g1~~TRINITY_DN2189_c0_g1_i1.p1  ORF type:complete len:369 (+),score=106.08 TRINITY_DN2189_c0_g1_i1:784-1890(+)